MERMTREEVHSLTDREVKMAYERIKKDHSYGLLSDRVTPLENTHLLEEELHKRGFSTVR